MNKIVVSKDIQKALKIVLEQAGNLPKAVFEREEFLVDDARAVIDEAYIASHTTKKLILVATKYNEFAQNALLKVLEEPPVNIEIILIAPRKSLFLPTIRSRLTVEYINSSKPQYEKIINFDTLDLKTVYNFVKNFQYKPQEESKAVVESALDFYIKNFKKLPKKRVLDLIERSYALININTPSHIAILPLLLVLLEEKNGSKTSR